MWGRADGRRGVTVSQSVLLSEVGRCTRSGMKDKRYPCFFFGTSVRRCLNRWGKTSYFVANPYRQTGDAVGALGKAPRPSDFDFPR